MHQRPRFGIEHSALAAFVVFRRIVVDGEQLAKRIQLPRTQGFQVIGNQFAEMDLAIFFNSEGAVVFSETLIEPRGYVA